MGATKTETVREFVKAMIQSGIIKPDKNAKSPLRDILKKSILLQEYGVRTYRDPETLKVVDRIIADENTKRGAKGESKSREKPGEKPPTKKFNVVKSLKEVERKPSQT